MAQVLSEREGAVALLTLNNPAQYNALGTELMRDFQAALDHAIADPAVRVILLTGAGKGFCSGAQFGGDTFSQGEAIGARMRQSINPVIERLRQSPKPVVTAVNGAAAGAGVGVALAGDVVFAARSARFILSFARLGAVLDGGTSLFLQRSIGAARARVLALTGEALPAQTAADWGLVWQCVDDERLMDEARAMARRLAEGAPLAQAMIKRQLDAAWAAGLDDTLVTEADAQSRAFVTQDLKEGASAFVEKRPPRFVGR
ncbi:MAG: enoyl-CoA hydratase-related protein [Burkholderiaceae bacterium]|nr:enoyl-CoA hydratase-related protein [Burkholderiaceae bacterium]